MDSLHIEDIDYIELYVGNSYQAMNFYRSIIGFEPFAYAGLETGVSDRSSFAISQGETKLLLTGAHSPNCAIAEHVALHGDGVKNIALRVDDASYAFEEAVRRGADPLQEPIAFEISSGKIVTSTVTGFGDTVHTFVQRKQSEHWLLPNYQPYDMDYSISTLPGVGINSIDHVTICVESGDLERYSNYYSQVFGFEETYQLDLDDKMTGMNSKVLENESRRVKFVLCEPCSVASKSQIQEYLNFYGGSGVQHIAFTSSDIIETIRQLIFRGLQFMPQPNIYYDSLESRIGKIDEDIGDLRLLGILADRDSQGYMLQAFSKILQDRPTLFLEVIQRNGMQSFGKGNIQALFEAVQHEQAKRGNA
jgi:4-hydroxyphenylpyruvate dioxygenase